MNKNPVFSLMLLLCITFNTYAITEINSLTTDTVKIIESNKNVVNIIGKNNWVKIKHLSELVIKDKGTLSGIKETKYISLREQIKIMKAINKSNINIEIKLVLLDLLAQYYFYTYYYNHHGKFKEPYNSFLKDIGAKYAYYELAGRNLFLHNYLLELVNLDNESAIVNYYKSIYAKNKFDEWPKGGD